MRIGVIGGSGLYEMEGLTDVRFEAVKTPYGEPSDEYILGRLGDREVVFLPRHGRGHRFLPGELPSRANIWGFKKLGVEPDTAQIAMLPQNYVKLEGRAAQQMLKLMEALEDHDDTRNVWSNFDVEEQEIEASLA